MSAKLLATSIWEAVEILDRVDQEPFGEVSKLLDQLSNKLVRAAINAEADARLIAAAPALLEALEECAPELRIMSEWANGPTSAAYSEKYARALAAISLAKGEAK